MIDREKVINAVETAFDVWIDDSTGLSWFKEDEARHAKDEVLALLKEQEEQKRKWLQTIADTQLAISPTGYESEDELAKRGGEWNGLQIAWEIIAGEERSEHPRLVRCKDCKWRGTNACFCKARDDVQDDWFCSEGERKEGR